jgi:hypothetical protein
MEPVVRHGWIRWGGAGRIAYFHGAHQRISLASNQKKFQVYLVSMKNQEFLEVFLEIILQAPPNQHRIAAV